MLTAIRIYFNDQLPSAVFCLTASHTQAPSSRVEVKAAAASVFQPQRFFRQSQNREQSGSGARETCRAHATHGTSRSFPPEFEVAVGSAFFRPILSILLPLSTALSRASRSLRSASSSSGAVASPKSPDPFGKVDVMLKVALFNVGPRRIHVAKAFY